MIAGRDWRAVAVVKHIGHASSQWQKGHYYTYVLEDDDEWWKHEDKVPPTSIPAGCTDMEGVTVMLFQVVTYICFVRSIN